MGRALSYGVVTLADNAITTPDVITFASPPTPTSAFTTTTTDSALAVGNTGDTGAVTYSSNTLLTCTVASTTGALTYLTAGVCTIEATQAADAAGGFVLTTANTSITLAVPTDYSVIFEGNASTGGATATETANVPTPLNANGFSRSGYAFADWNTAADGSGVTYADGATYPFVAAATLYAQWSANLVGTTPPPPPTVSVTLIQGGAESAPVADGSGYSGQLEVTNANGTVSFTETGSLYSADVVATSTGAISAATSLAQGTYPVSGGESDINGDTGAWTFTLTVTPIRTKSPVSTAGGYDLVGSDGGVFVFGGSGTGFYGSLPGMGIHVNDIVGMANTIDFQGYYLVGSDGGVFAFGDAKFLGSLPGMGIHVNDIVGIVPTINGGGYFLVGKDGGVFAFGEAPFAGSLPGLGTQVTNIVGIAATPTDRGYWIVGSSGHVYAFGDANNLGGVPGAITSIASTPDGGGYWLSGSDGGVFGFGDAPFEGSLPGIGVKVNDVVSLVPSSDGNGYLLTGSDGAVFALGDAPFEGSLPGIGVMVNDIVGAVSTGLSQ